MADNWTFGETTLEIPVPCPSGVGTSDCLSPAQIFPGEHDVHMVEVGPSPAIEVQLPPTPPMLPIDSPAPSQAAETVVQTPAAVTVHVDFKSQVIGLIGTHL